MPRQQTLLTGRRRAGTEPMPETAREQGRSLGLEDASVYVGTYAPITALGQSRAAWDWSLPVRGRIEPLGFGGGSVTGGRIDESSTHMAYLDPQPITTKDRLRALGIEWIITAMHEQTDPAVRSMEVRQA